MATGTKYTTKQTLLDSIVAKVFKNNSFKVTATSIQAAMCDMVESLWDSRTVTTFTASSDYITVAGERYLHGNEVNFRFKITHLTNAGNAADFVTITDLIPQNFESREWFKPEHLTIILNDVIGGTGNFGYIEFNDLNTYQDGVLTVADNTRLFVPGNTKGDIRTFVFDQPDLNYQNYDLEETTTSNNYVQNSPKDITVSGLNMTIRNMSDVLGASETNKEGEILFHLKGVLL